jgi:ADP-heptose:LPS heptosyltransferase
LTDFTAKLDLLQAQALLERAALFVGNDSGLMHMAAAAGTPTLGLFGPTDESIYGPFGPRSLAVRGPRSFAELSALDPEWRGDQSLMLDLTPQRVVEAASSLIQRATSGALHA